MATIPVSSSSASDAFVGGESILAFVVPTLGQSAPPLSTPGAAAAGAPTAGGAANTQAGNATTGAGSGSGAIGGGTQAQPPSPFPMLLLVGVMVAIILFSVVGNRKETKKKAAMLESLKKNDRVQTVGGIIGSIVEIKPEVVVLKVDENSNTRVTFARSSVVGVVKEAAPDASNQPTQR